MVAGPPRLALLALLALAPAACGGSPSNRPIEGTGPAPQHFVTRLDDERHALPDGRVAWQAWWAVCWDEYPGATSFEVRTVTGEGVSPRLRRQTARCIRVEAAAGEDPPESVDARRATLLALQAGQLAYQVRAVFDGGRRGEWSAPQAVGPTT